MMILWELHFLLTCKFLYEINVPVCKIDRLFPSVCTELVNINTVKIKYLRIVLPEWKAICNQENVSNEVLK